MLDDTINWQLQSTIVKLGWRLDRSFVWWGSFYFVFSFLLFLLFYFRIHPLQWNANRSDRWRCEMGKSMVRSSFIVVVRCRIRRSRAILSDLDVLSAFPMVCISMGRTSTSNCALHWSSTLQSGKRKRWVLCDQLIQTVITNGQGHDVVWWWSTVLPACYDNVAHCCCFCFRPRSTHCFVLRTSFKSGSAFISQP